MENRLYVTNLSEVASLSSLRRCFAAFGEVTDVQFAAERNAQRGPPAAYITMATSAAAEQAMRRLNGTLLDGRPMMVSVLPERSSDERREDKKAAARAHAAIIAVTQQYRERHNMTYELDCPVGRLTLRIFFPPDAARPEWRIEARSNRSGALTVDKSAATRELALKEVAEAWQ